MSMIMIGLGLILLLAAGEALVRGGAAVAVRLGVSPMLVGLVLVGFGTSTPELVTSVQAALVGSPGIAVGNIVGSNIANVLLILGLAAVIAPLAIDRRALWRDGAVVLAGTALFAIFALQDGLGRLDGVILIAGLAAYLVLAVIMERRSAAAAGQAIAEDAMALLPALLLAVGGIVGVIIGARFLVGGAIDVARLWGVSEALIGVTIVAVGTSLPEMAASTIAAIRRQPELAFGNVIGSNIYNILGIGGVTALVQPGPLPAEIVDLDLWVMLGATIVLVLFAATGRRFTRGEGAICLIGYGTYIAALTW